MSKNALEVKVAGIERLTPLKISEKLESLVQRLDGSNWGDRVKHMQDVLKGPKAGDLSEAELRAFKRIINNLEVALSEFEEHIELAIAA